MGKRRIRHRFNEDMMARCGWLLQREVVAATGLTQQEVSSLLRGSTMRADQALRILLAAPRCAALTLADLVEGGDAIAKGIAEGVDGGTEARAPRPVLQGPTGGRRRPSRPETRDG